nr:hypothetical protein [Tanacetum cinerariifolium]
TMATTIDQQTTLDESLVPSTQRAFQVTADVPEIYMQEFWATAKLQHNSIRFKIDTRKSASARKKKGESASSTTPPTPTPTTTVESAPRLSVTA